MKNINNPANTPQKKKTARKFKKWSFEYWYMIIMIIYMAQMTADTGRMIGFISGPPVPFLLPILLTVILLVRNHISWKNKNLMIALAVMTLWSIFQLIKYRDVSLGFLSYFFFFYYAVIIAYIHVKVYGLKLFIFYEDIITIFAFFAIPLWLISVLDPESSYFFRQFPETGYGHNFLYIFNWMADPEQYYNGIMRNAGFSWEPGRFAIMICLGMLCNLFRRGIKFKNNTNQIILIVALITTQSTTGYTLALLLYVVFLIKHISFRSIIRICIFMIPVIWAFTNVDFLYDKIMDKMEVESYVEDFTVAEEYNSTHGGLERHTSLDRFVSMYFESINIMEDPILGYSRDFSKSNFGKNFSEDYSLTGGLLSVFGIYGIIFGIMIYIILFISSIRISKEVNYKRRLAIFICFIVSSISYKLFCIPVYTAIWMYGIFIDNNYPSISKTNKRKNKHLQYKKQRR